MFDPAITDNSVDGYHTPTAKADMKTRGRSATSDRIQLDRTRQGIDRQGIDRQRRQQREAQRIRDLKAAELSRAWEDRRVAEQELVSWLGGHFELHRLDAGIYVVDVFSPVHELFTSDRFKLWPGSPPNELAIELRAEPPH